MVGFARSIRGSNSTTLDSAAIEAARNFV
jgi:hypothetical protein